MSIVLESLHGDKSSKVLDQLSAFLPGSAHWFLDIALIMIKLYTGFVRRDKQLSSAKPGKHVQDTPSRKLKFWPHVETLEFFLLTYSVAPDLAMSSPHFPEVKRMDEFITPLLIDTILRTDDLEGKRLVGASPAMMRFDEATNCIVGDHELGPASLLSGAIIYDLHVILGSKANEIHESMRTSVEAAWDIVKGPISNLETGIPGLRFEWKKEDTIHLGTIKGLYMLGERSCSNRLYTISRLPAST